MQSMYEGNILFERFRIFSISDFFPPPKPLSKMLKNYLLLVLSACLLINLSAQPTALNLPKVSKELLATEQYESFPDAEAVITQDYGDLSFMVVNGQLKLYYRYLRQVKVLQEPGAKWATVRIPYKADEKITQVFGTTYTLSENGNKVVRVKFNKDDILDYRLAGSQREMVLRLPPPRPGAVFAYSYVLQTEDYGRLRPWQFQQSIPVLYSEYVTHIPEEFEYLGILQGENKDLRKETSNQAQSHRFRFVQREDGLPRVIAKQVHHSLPPMATISSYSMSEIPAFEEEPLMSSPNNYMPRLRFQLSRVKGLDEGNGRIIRSWRDLNDRLLAHPNFGQQLGLYADWKAETQRLLGDLPEGREQIEQLFNQVRKRINWNRVYGTFAEQDLPEVYRNKAGNSVEINLLLTAMLRSLEYKAYPVLVSTRSHGQVSSLFPILEQFNHVIVQVDYRGERILMDASQDFVPMGMLPAHLINGLGYRIHERRSGWQPLRPQHEKFRRTYARFVLDEDGRLNGRIRHLDKGYSAARTRAMLANYDQEVESFFRDHMIAEFDEFELGELSVKDKDRLGEPVATKYEIGTSDYVTQSGELVLVSPLLSEGYDQNPFGMGERRYPVDFGVPIAEQYLLVLSLPDNYEFEVVPEDIQVNLPNDGGRFLYRTLIINNHIQLLSKIEINKTLFKPGEYDALRSFFDHIAAKHSQKLVIRKRSRG
jgi:hypothetical protein